MSVLIYEIIATIIATSITIGYSLANIAIFPYRSIRGCDTSKIEELGGGIARRDAEDEFRALPFLAVGTAHYVTLPMHG